MTSIRIKALMASTTLAALALSAVPVAADDFAGFSSFQQLDDASLSTLRGRYIAPSSASAGVPLASRNTTNLPQPLPAGVVASASTLNANPLSDVQGSGTVTYFGVQMISSWSVQNGTQTQGVAAGVTVGIDATTQTISVQKWSSTQNGGLPALSADGNSVSGQPPADNVNGVGQSIQVAGSGNDVSNSSTLVISASGPTLTVAPTTTTCSPSVCTTTVEAGLLGVSIDTTVGKVAQQIGAGGVTQSVQLAGNGNAIVNSMTMGAQVKPGNGFNADNLLPVLQTINWSR